MTRADVAIVGAGLAGLACTRWLARSGVESLLVEAGDRSGGRVRTDRVDGLLARPRLPGLPALLAERGHARRAG